jgi:flavin-dependent dehydrogenase
MSGTSGAMMKDTGSSTMPSGQDSSKPERPLCGTQEKEFEGDAEEIAACRAGKDGEPEVLLHDDMKGYSWNVPKSQWLNVGSGTTVAREVTTAWSEARAFFEGHGISGTIPVSSRPMLDKMKGHGYRSFETPHLGNCQRDGAFLVGDALGLAHPMTGEGIMPAILSGKLCATAIAKGAPQDYSYRMQVHPVLSDYQLLHSIKTRVKRSSAKKKENRQRRTMLHSWIVVKIFAIMFSARPLPGSHLFAWMRRRRYKPAG